MFHEAKFTPVKGQFFFFIISFWIYVLMSFSFLLVLKCPSVCKIVVMAGDIRNDHHLTTCESWWVTRRSCRSPSSVTAALRCDAPHSDEQGPGSLGAISTTCSQSSSLREPSLAPGPRLVGPRAGEPAPSCPVSVPPFVPPAGHLLEGSCVSPTWHSAWHTGLAQSIFVE